MELYQLKPQTLEILNLLRLAGSGGPYDYQRGSGKTTALHLRAKELMDTTIQAGNGDVIVLTPYLSYSADNWKQLFGKAKMPIFSSSPGIIRGRRNGGFLLIDEPRAVRWSDDDLRDARAYRYRVEKVGI